MLFLSLLIRFTWNITKQSNHDLIVLDSEHQMDGASQCRDSQPNNDSGLVPAQQLCFAPIIHIKRERSKILSLPAIVHHIRLDLISN